jgi:hypothetical protein
VSRRAGVAAGLLLAATAFLPFARGLLSGQSLYFRDLALQFLPARLFALEGLLHGQLRYWNPYVHEGAPVTLPPLGSPLDLLQLLSPGPWGISLILALHVPLAALAFFLLARSLELDVAAAAGGSLVYALSGFTLASVNLYVYVEAIAWAPLAIWALGRAAGGERRAIAVCAVLVAGLVSTTGAEIAAQALLAGLVLAWRPGARPASLAAGVGLGLALSAWITLPLSALVADSARGSGFPTAVVLSHSVHPLTLVQTLISGWYGDPADIAGRWWGINFFPRGFPYVLSLYLGPLALSLAGVGLRFGGSLARRAAALGLAGLVVSLGRYVGWGVLLDPLPARRALPGEGVLLGRAGRGAARGPRARGARAARRPRLAQPVADRREPRGSARREPALAPAAARRHALVPGGLLPARVSPRAARGRRALRAE